jgi:hypothetical protein
LSLPFRFSNQITVYISHIFLVCYMPRSSHPPWFRNTNNIWWLVQVMKLLIMQPSLAFCHFLHLSSKYSPQDPVLKQPQSISFLGVRHYISHTYKATGTHKPPHQNGRGCRQEMFLKILSVSDYSFVFCRLE